MHTERHKIINKIAKAKLAVAIVGAIVIALVLTAISIAIYVRSGVASLDLSRPGYEQVRDQVRTDKANTFDSVGPINKRSLEEFQRLYRTELQELSNSSAFSDHSLDDSQLRLDAGQTSEQVTP